MNIEIFDLAFGGQGVGRLDNGRIVFVPFTIPGETVQISELKTKSNYSVAKLCKVIKPSPHRIEPICEYYTNCGGCQYMHIDYKYEVSYKKKQLLDVLKRIGKIDQEKNFFELDVVASPKDLYYRNSITLQKLQNRLGFFSCDNKEIVDIKQCAIAQQNINDFIQELLGLPLEKIPIKTDGNIIVYPGKENPLKLNVGGYDFLFDHRTFFQINTDMLQQIIQKMDSGISKSDCLFDLYCGVGLYSICFKEGFKKIIGVDANFHSVCFANKNKELNPGINNDNMHFFQSNVASVFKDIYKLHKQDKNVIIVNPPRVGLDRKLKSMLVKQKDVSQLIYIACDPAILARDLCYLMKEGNFAVEKICLFDMFPRTKYFETVVFLKRVCCKIRG